MADGPHLGIRPGSDLPRRTAGRGGPVRGGHRGLPSRERRDGARHSHREHGTDPVPSTGTRRKRKVRYSCWPAGPWESTIGPLTVAALRILHGKVHAHGVLAPEAVFEPIPFLEEAARFRSTSQEPGRLLQESEEVLG